MFNQQQQFHCSTRNNINISHKKLHNISVVFNQKRMCSICSTNVTKNLRSTHTKKLKAKFSQRSRHSRLAAKYLGAQPKDLLMFSRVKFMQWSVIFQNKRLAIFVLFCTLPTYCWPSYCSYVSFFGHYWHFVYFDFQRNYHDMKYTFLKKCDLISFWTWRTQETNSVLPPLLE